VLGVGLVLYVGLLVIDRLGWRDLGWRYLSLGQVALGCAGFVATTGIFVAYLALASDLTPGRFVEAVVATTWRERLLGLFIGFTFPWDAGVVRWPVDARPVPWRAARSRCAAVGGGHRAHADLNSHRAL
jgi:hypothetical protein